MSTDNRREEDEGMEKTQFNVTNELVYQNEEKKKNGKMKEKRKRKMEKTRMK